MEPGNTYFEVGDITKRNKFRKLMISKLIGWCQNKIEQLEMFKFFQKII